MDNPTEMPHKVLVYASLFIFKRDRFTVQHMLINRDAIFLPGDILYRLCKQYDHVLMLLKNQSAHSAGSHLNNLCPNSCKFINHGTKPSGQQ